MSVIPSNTVEPAVQAISWEYDAEHDMLDRYGDCIICIRPPSGDFHIYWVRIFDKDMKIITDPRSPISFYDACYPNRRVATRDNYLIWSGLHSRKYLLKDGNKIIAEFGGETVVRQLPYRSVGRGYKL